MMKNAPLFLRLARFTSSSLIFLVVVVAVIVILKSSDCYSQATTTTTTTTTTTASSSNIFSSSSSSSTITTTSSQNNDISSSSLMMRRASSSSPTIMQNNNDNINIDDDDEDDHERNHVQQRKLQNFEKIWHYQPRTKITDVAGIDLDMKVISGLLDLGRFDDAEKVYKEGGHVGSTAILELVVALDQDIPAGQSALLKAGVNGEDTVAGTLYVNGKRGDKLLLISYATTANQDDFVGCQVGALPDPKTSGCFVESGSVEFPDLNRSYDYTYKQLEENINLRTLLTLSLEAQNFVENDTFNKYREYYVSPLYADEITTAAFNNRNSGSKRGEMDFSIFQDKGNKETAEMAIVLLTVWMSVVGSMENAVYECNVRNCGKEPCQNKPGVFAWDAAVAYYAGSLVDPPTNTGNLLFYYADSHCGDFNTCGEAGGQSDGTSFVNHDIFHWFVRGQRDLLESYCDGAEIAKNKIIELMTVPLMQGAIRYAHMVQGEMSRVEIEKHDAEAAGYALAVLPLIYHCSPEDAQIVYDNLKPKSPAAVDFAKVKYALEKNYHCMNVRCHHVGGIVSSTYPYNTYREGAEPCTEVTAGLTEEQRKLAIALGLSFGGLFIIAIVVCVVQKTEPKCLSKRQSNDVQLEPTTDGEMT